MLKKPIALIFTVAMLFTFATVPRAADIGTEDSVAHVYR